MANSKASSMYSGKHSQLPPKIPFPSVSQSHSDNVPNPMIGSNVAQKPREGHNNLRRTSSESLVNIIEEQPSWLDDLLNEPETPVRRGGHRRSSSDSFAYLDTCNAFNISYTDQDEYQYKNSTSIPSWASQDIDHGKGAYQIPIYAEMNSAKKKNRAWESSVNALTHPGGPSGRDNVALHSSGSSCASREVDGNASTVSEKYESVEPGGQDAKSSSGRKDGSHAKPSTSETDTKRAKQQFAQRSRVRKLQYIAELERNVQALQVEGNEVSAELDFLNQRNLILSMENNALKQRLENLAQEQLIKYLEQEVLEREAGRLRALYQQQQQQAHHLTPQQSSSGPRRTRSRDLESQFANLSMKHKESNSDRDPVTGPLRS
ncbi:uncharacterized protein At4g06598-like [Prosopis cineraria]|uniref:uncharacterized protein At4g06598-like n=1 Tax=Prosopis cineraria TaxID=364024 RepID=UPI00240EC8D5|nr:uncharacterized protein At4g06598-like [Prosopis cineraria]